MRILITGATGLVGSHAAEYFSKKEYEVIAIDNLMRSSIFGYDKKSVEYNWDYLKKYKNIKLIKADVRDKESVLDAIGDGVDALIHAAGQPGVPSSVRIPENDFSINAYGTLNVLECIRKRSPGAVVIYCSTNKVYGENVDKIQLEEKDTRYEYKDTDGICEDLGIDLTGHTPYGASKFTGDIYMQEYGHIYGMKTACFRMSCVSGDTKVSTLQGDIKIKDIENVETNVYCFSKNIDTKPISGSFRTRNKGKKLYELKTKNGYKIKATGDHRFFTPDGYIELDKIPYGSLIAVCPEFFNICRKHVSEYSDKRKIIKEKLYIEKLKKYKRSEKSNKAYLKKLKKAKLIPFTYNNSEIYTVARLVGYLTGDGHMYFRIRDNGKAYTEIQVYGIKEELGAIKKDFKKLGFKPGKTSYSRSSSKLSNGHVIKGTSYRFSVTQTDAFAFFELLEVPLGNKSRVKYKIPKWILKGPKDIQDEYLAGLFGAEMSAPSFKPRKGIKQELQPPHFTQCKIERLYKNLQSFRKQIVNILKNRGIETRVYKSKVDFFSKRDKSKSICYDLVIKSSRENIIKLSKIGFAYNKKRKNQIMKIAEFLKTGLPYNFYNDWEKENTYKLKDSGLIWDKIVQKKEISMEDIYDITVPENHNFFANGFLVHNCTYGIRQFGFEDQGWVAWFIIAAFLNKGITIYGDGKQVRDLLYVSDLIDAFDKFIDSDLKGSHVFNIGGGKDNTVSLLEFLDILGQLTNKDISVIHKDWRPSDQKVYISNISKAKDSLGWVPGVSVKQGIEKLIDWVKDNENIFK